MTATERLKAARERYDRAIAAAIAEYQSERNAVIAEETMKRGGATTEANKAERNAEIWLLRDQGMSFRAIGDIFNLSPSHAKTIVDAENRRRANELRPKEPPHVWTGEALMGESALSSLSVRSCNVLSDAASTLTALKMMTISDAAKRFTRSELLSLPRCGRKSLNEITEFFANAGHPLRD
jgi:hypothetical protein